VNLATASKIYIGSSEVAKVSFGTTEIWSSIVPWDGTIPLMVPPIPLVVVATGIKAEEPVLIDVPLAVPPIPEVKFVAVGPPWDGFMRLEMPVIPSVGVSTVILLKRRYQYPFALTMPVVPVIALDGGGPAMEAEWMAWDYDPFDPMLNEDTLVTQVFE